MNGKSYGLGESIIAPFPLFFLYRVCPDSYHDELRAYRFPPTQPFRLRQRYVQAIEYESELNHCTGGTKDTKGYYNAFLLRQQSGSGLNGSLSNLVNLANVAEAQV